MKESKEIKYLAGAILNVKLSEENYEKAVNRGPQFTGKGISVPNREAEHVLTIDSYDKPIGRSLGVDISYGENFGGYLSSPKPQSLHPSLNGKNLIEILDFYINHKNNVENKEEQVISLIKKVGYVPERNNVKIYENENDRHLFTDVEYTDGQEYLTLEEYIKLGKPKILLKKIILEKKN